MSAKIVATYQNSKAEEHARWRRRDHANIEAMQNLMLDAIVQETNCVCPPKVRAFISALQSAHGGGEVVNEPFQRSHETVAAYLHFQGTKEAKEARVRRLIDRMEQFQQQAGYLLFHVTRGGQPTGQKDAQGNEIFSKTEYVDFLKPVADEAVMRARKSDLWRGNSGKGIKPHPGKALAAEALWAIAQLPRLQPVDPGDDPDPPFQPLHEYEQKQEERLLKSLENVADEIERRGGDAASWLERLENRIRRAALSRKKTFKARNDHSAVDAVGDEDMQDSGTAYMSNKIEPPDSEDTSAQAAAGGVTNLLPGPPLSTDESCALETEEAPHMLDEALKLASWGFAIFPLHTPDLEGLCSCAAAAACRSPGKHPRTARGVKDATTDEARIRSWWAKWPDANIGLATGNVSGVVALDIDPRHGGDASISALIEQYGEMPDTLEAITGGNGSHILFAHPGISFKNSASAIGEGLDVKTDGGSIVAVPSLHASGRRYAWKSGADLAEMPTWLLDLLTAPQPGPTHAATAGCANGGFKAVGPTISEGSRNVRLFKIACALRGNGADLNEIEAALAEVNLLRCNPPLEEDEIRRIAASAAKYNPKGRTRAAPVAVVPIHRT